MRAVQPIVREAGSGDVAAICHFGATYIRPHSTPLIGAEAASAQVRWWWNPTHIGAAVADGLVVVAEIQGQLVGVGQRGRSGADHVFYKLYIHPDHRGLGVGPVCSTLSPDSWLPTPTVCSSSTPQRPPR